MSWPWNLASLFSCCRTTCARWNSVVTLSSKGWRDLSRVPANQISLCITFIKCDFLVPVGGMSVCSGSSSLGQYVVVVVLEGLENAHSVTELLGDLCEAQPTCSTTGSSQSTPSPALGNPLQQEAIDVPAQIPAPRLKQQGTAATSQQKQQQYLRTTNTHYDH